MLLFTKYGHFLSAIIQLIMYQFAADQLMSKFFSNLSGTTGTILYASFILVPLILVKVCETKYAQRFMTDD
jgi:hypothetical protein